MKLINSIKAFLRALLNDFKELPEGVKRLIYVGCVAIPLIIGIITEGGYWIEVFIPYFLVYWVLIFVAQWVYKGFKESK